MRFRKVTLQAAGRFSDLGKLSCTLQEGFQTFGSDAARCRTVSKNLEVALHAAGSLLYITTNAKAIRHYHSTPICLIFRVSELIATSINQ